MESEAYTLGRLMRYESRQLALVAATPQTVPGNSNRVALNIALVNLAIPITAFTFITIDGTILFNLTAYVPFIHINMRDYGNLPTRAFTLQCNNAAQSVGIVEYFLPEEYLAACRCKFDTEYSKWLNSNSPPKQW